MYVDAPLRIVGAVLSDLTSNRKALSSVVRTYMDQRSMARGPGRVPTVSIFEIVPDAAQRRIVLQNSFEGLLAYPTGPLQPLVETGTVSPRETTYLLLLLSSTRGELIIEFGTNFGDSTLLFALNSPQTARVLTTNYPERPDVGVKARVPEASSKIELSFSKTQEWDLSAYKHAADFIFVDASHEYDDVAADTVKALELIRPGGVIVWHDYRFKHRHTIVKALDEILPKYPLFHLRYSSLVVYREPAKTNGSAPA
jgi:predicted O-methyltransferase YrrM